MKQFILHNSNLLGLLFCVLSAFSCAKGPGPNDMIRLSQGEIWFGAEGGTIVITVNQVICFDTIYFFDEQGNKKVGIHKELYDIKNDDSIEFDWITVLKKDADNVHSLIFEAQPNTTGSDRKLSVLIVRDSFDVIKEIPVRQTAK